MICWFVVGDNSRAAIAFGRQRYRKKLPLLLSDQRINLSPGSNRSCGLDARCVSGMEIWRAHKAMTADRPAPTSIAIGLFWMTGCLASFIGMAVASRELSETLSIFQIFVFQIIDRAASD